MRHLATYMLLVLGGNASPTKEDVTTALSAVGVDVSLILTLAVLNFSMMDRPHLPYEYHKYLAFLGASRNA